MPFYTKKSASEELFPTPPMSEARSNNPPYKKDFLYPGNKISVI